MRKYNGVHLAPNGDYWQAWWYDRRGNQRKKSVGRRNGPGKLSKAAALRACHVLQESHVIEPTTRDPSTAPTLGEWKDRYADLRRNELGQTTMGLHLKTFEYIGTFVESDDCQHQIQTIGDMTHEFADDWRAWLSNQKAHRGPAPKDDTPRRGGSRMAEATVCGHVRNAKVMFARARKRRHISINPFEELVGTAPDPDKDKRAKLTAKQIARLIDAADSPSWKALVALCAYAGLRRSEALRIEWNDVRWDENRLNVTNPLWTMMFLLTLQSGNRVLAKFTS